MTPPPFRLNWTFVNRQALIFDSSVEDGMPSFRALGGPTDDGVQESPSIQNLFVLRRAAREAWHPVLDLESKIQSAGD